VRFVCISDTHEKLDEILHLIPDGDVLIHSGDFTNYGDVSEVIKFNAEMGKLPHKVKIATNFPTGFPTPVLCFPCAHDFNSTSFISNY